jgi:hypothetical protein
MYHAHANDESGTAYYAYAFMNTDTRAAYARLFRELFSTLADVARKPIYFAYLDTHGRGIRTITADMCKKQAGGKCYHMLGVSPADAQHMSGK